MSKKSVLSENFFIIPEEFLDGTFNQSQIKIYVN